MSTVDGIALLERAHPVVQQAIASVVLARPGARTQGPDAYTWATTEARMLDPLAGPRPFVPYPYQAAILQDSSQRRLILKARQVGISLTVALEALYNSLHRAPWLGLFISRNQDLAQQLIAYCQYALGGLQQVPDLLTESRSELGFANGSRILALPANPAAGRGFPASALYLDEFAWCQYAQQIYDGASAAVAPGGQVTVLSTPNGRNNLFFRLWEGLEGGAWARHRVHWADCPRYTDDPTWEATKRAELTREAFAQEYDCDFVTSGAAVFAPDDLTRAKQDWNPDPRGCEQFVTAWDIGRRQDWTVGITWGRRGEVWHEVAFWRDRVPYPVVEAVIDARTALYGPPYIESNGVGDPVIENLTTAALPFTTTARTKLQAVQALQLLLQHGHLKYGSPELDRELALYEWADEALVQDCVMAAAIGALQIVTAPGPSNIY